jgi:hypothetical protein
VEPVVTDTVPVSYPGLPFALAKLAWLHDIANPTAWKFVPALACVEDDVELTGTGDPAHGIPAPAPQLVMPVIPNVEPFVTLGSSGYLAMPWPARKDVCCAGGLDGDRHQRQRPEAASVLAQGD